MTIKARPYGGKPSIAVSKETKHCVLTVWSVKLRGAVTPVAPWRKEKVKKTEVKGTNNPCHWCSLLSDIFASSSLWICALWLSSGGYVTILLIPTGRGFEYTTTIWQLKYRFKQMFALATKSWMFNSALNQLDRNITLVQPILILSQLNPLETASPHHIASPFLPDN